jgi:hypothetical protein
MASRGTNTGLVASNFSPGLSAVSHRLLRRYLRPLNVGTLTVTLPSGAAIQHKGARADPEAVLVIRRWRALWRMMLAGDLGLAMSSMRFRIWSSLRSSWRRGAGRSFVCCRP